MDNLDETRRRIDDIDTRLLALFLERMQLAEDVAAYKIPRKLPVYNEKREKEVLASIKKNACPQFSKSAANLFSTIMRLSREWQYAKASRQDTDWALGNQLKSAANRRLTIQTAAYGGKEGSYSEQAAAKLFPDTELLASPGFEEACRAASEGRADAAVLPLDNTTAGSVSGTGELLQKYGLYIFRSTVLTIKHALMAKPGTMLSDIREVRSHPQALAQCTGTIREHGWNAVPMDNTAFAAEYAASSPDGCVAAIGSEDAARLYGLAILQKGINDSASNQTRFVAAAKEMSILPAASKVSLVFRQAHESGTLANALAIFSDAGLNLMRIQSEPIPEAPWEYSFYLDFAAMAPDARAMAALYQLEKESHFMRLLGWYTEE